MKHPKESEPLPQLFLGNADSLCALRKRRSDSDTLSPGLERLRREADAVLSAGPFSVMDKATVPPGGDKHDYLSYGPYWWPNPETEDGLPYVRRDGEVNPERDTLDNKPFAELCATVETLSLAFFFIEHAAYAEHAARLLRIWFLDATTRMNPHLEFGQAIPGVCEGRGIGIIDTATRLPGLIDALGLLAGSPAWTAADAAGLRDWMGRYLTWLRESEKGRDEARQHNNHGTWYDAQAVALALFLDRPEVAREILETAGERRVAAHIEPDGRQPHELARTRAFSYSVMNLRGLFDLATLGQQVVVDLWRYPAPEGPSLGAALDFLLPYALGDMPWSYPQITPFNAPAALLPLVRRARQVYGEDRYGAADRRLSALVPPDARTHLLYPAPSKAGGQP